MNIESYKTWVVSLENEIKTRESERQSMQQTIQQMDKQLQQYVNKNKALKQQNTYLNKARENLLLQLKKKEEIIAEKNSLLSDKAGGDEDLKKRLAVLEAQKKSIEEELKQKDLMLGERNIKLRDLESENRKNTSLIEGYKNIVNEKARELARNQTKVRQLQSQKESISKQLTNTKAHFQLQKSTLLQRSKQSQGSASQLARQQSQRILQLQKQLYDTKQFHKSQLQTLAFNHQQQLKQLNSKIASLQQEIKQHLQHVQQLTKAQQQMKRHYEVQFANKDEVVNGLINQVNFFKEEKAKIKEEHALKIDQLVMATFVIGEEKKKPQDKISTLESQLDQVKEEGAEKDRIIQQLKAKINELEGKLQGLMTHSQSTSLSLSKEVQQLRTKLTQSQSQQSLLTNQLQSLTKTLQQCQTSHTQLQITLHQYQSQLTSSQQSLQQQKQKSFMLTNQLKQVQQKLKQVQKQSASKILDLEEKLTSLQMKQSSSTQSASTLQDIVKQHQFTIQKLQALLQQSKIVIQEVNVLMKTKLAELEVLQDSNKMFRQEKLDWIRKEEDYRKKIIQLRNTQSNTSRKLTESNVNFNRSNYRSYTQFSKKALQSAISNIKPTLNPTPRTKTLIPSNWLQRLNAYTHDDMINSNDHSTQNPPEDLSLQLITSENTFQSMNPGIQADIANTKKLSSSGNNGTAKTKVKTSMSHESPTAADLMKKKDKKLVMFDNSENSEIRGSDKQEGEGIHMLLDKLDGKE